MSLEKLTSEVLEMFSQEPFTDTFAYVVTFTLPGGLVFQAHRLLYHSTLGLRVIQK